MSKQRRMILIASVIAICLLVVLVRWSSSDELVMHANDAPAPSTQPEGDRPGPLHAGPHTAQKREPASVRPPIAGNPATTGRPACDACRERECTNYQGQGVDMLSGCFTHVEGAYGASENDPQFIADCTAVVRCAEKTHCAESPAGASACYCGSRGVDECIEQGPGPDAPCLEQWRRAARTDDHQELTHRFSDLAYPAGWANFMIECDQTECRSACSGAG